MRKYSKEEIQIEASKYRSRTEFLEQAGGYYMSATRQSLLDEVCLHMPKNLLREQKPHNAKWDQNTLALETQKYKNRYALKKNNPSAFNAARRLNLLDIFYPKKDAFRNAPYSLDEIEKEVFKYSKRSEFKAANPYLYRMLRSSRNELELDKMFGHMAKSTNVSSLEKILIDIIKAQYPKAQKLRDRKISIPGKPYIEGFDIDLYIPELRKGIEFDGKYWHSVPGLKRSRIDWPKDDLANYHEIKDSYFLSRGIQILHIKEEDWIKNKDSCIKKCLEFLA